MNEKQFAIEVKYTIERQSEISESAKQLQIVNQETYLLAGNMLMSIKKLATYFVSLYAEPKKKAADAHKTICAKEKELLVPLQQAELQVKSKISAYLDAEEKRRIAEEEVRRKESEKMMALSLEAQASGDSEMAQEAAATAAIQASTVTYQRPTAPGISSRKIWRYRVTNIEEVPRMYLIVNDSALSALTRSLKDSCIVTIPGIEFYYETSIAGRLQSKSQLEIVPEIEIVETVKSKGIYHE